MLLALTQMAQKRLIWWGERPAELMFYDLYCGCALLRSLSSPVPGTGECCGCREHFMMFNRHLGAQQGEVILPQTSEVSAWVTSASRYPLDLGALNWRLWTGSRRIPRRGDGAGPCRCCAVLKVAQTFGQVCCFGAFLGLGGVLSTDLLQKIHIRLLLASIKSPGFQRTEKRYFYHGKHLF